MQASTSTTPVVRPELPHSKTDSSSSSSGSGSGSGSEHHSKGIHMPHLHMPHMHVPHPHMPQHVGESMAHIGMEVLEAAAWMGPGVSYVDIPPETQARMAGIPVPSEQAQTELESHRRTPPKA
ncbi:hypothetical protein EXIGLDRAFT_779195 [Exidia glandulosa HHB12029]|uniref:Uncharacterized protein n=1 Tax=Exidia glandulosa HHB12029 TaxID=1314781 RepID=A0A165C6A4_EXIGL|nr:hypothetical protein EXIGLDRAFT_779195 [Exidia glandulosa HHB12029]